MSDLNVCYLKARQIAKQEYEEENGIGSWDGADKYEREDWTMSTFERLNNNTTNNSNKKEINTMMNKNNARENRMETLKNAGIATENFFDVNMKLPMGAMIQVTMPNGEVHRVGGDYNKGTEWEIDPKQAEAYNALVKSAQSADSIAQQIMQSGYVKNTKLWRRWIAAHTFKLLGKVTAEKKWKGEVVYRSDWDRNFNKNYGYGYQFSMTLEELRVLSILEKEDKEAFEERNLFFTQDVVVALCKQYMRQLKKYIKKSREEHKRTCKGKEYVKLAKYGNVFIEDLQKKVYSPMEFVISVIEACDNYSELYKCFKDFCNKLNKLPYETPKCPEFKSAYRGNGGAYTLKNLIMYHNVNLDGCKNTMESMAKFNQLLDTYKTETWRFHELLKKTVYDNNFNLAESIERQKEV